MSTVITPHDIEKAQENWATAIVDIGAAFTEKKNYVSVAEQTIDNLYGYEYGPVLFKPTKASEMPFRFTKEDALSYFVKGHISEDAGFALQPWVAVRFDNQDVVIHHDTALAMGHYFFTNTNQESIKVEYSFGYFLDKTQTLRIQLHHSSLPYSS